MAISFRDERNTANRPRLGFWWRLWIVFTVLSAGAVLTSFTYGGAWGRLGPLAVFALSFSYSAITLVIGLSIRWIVKGIAR